MSQFKTFLYVSGVLITLPGWFYIAKTESLGFTLALLAIVIGTSFQLSNHD